ncbi:hypothetical protein ACFQ51_49360 [Streptomyces kaempferi]
MTGISRRALTAVLASFALVIGMSAEARGIVNGDRVTSLPSTPGWRRSRSCGTDGTRAPARAPW